MTDIVEFLVARLNEHEHFARAVEHAVGDQYDALMAAIGKTHQLSMVSLYWRSHDPARVLADVKAKRAIVEQWQQADEACRRNIGDSALNAVHWATLRVVLVSFAGAHQTHPDYAGGSVDDWTWPDDEAWRVA